MSGGFCTFADLGKFIFDIPDGKTISDTSFWSARVTFQTTKARCVIAWSDFWDISERRMSNPSSRRTPAVGSRQSSDPLNPSPPNILQYSTPIQYKVRKTGYYCVGRSYLYRQSVTS